MRHAGYGVFFFSRSSGRTRCYRDWSSDVCSSDLSNFIWTRSFDEPPVAVWKYASVAEMQERIATVNDGSVGTEPYQRVQGSLLEEVVRRHARQNPLVDFREGWTFTGLEQA